jgi:D-arginine dehydrogenase
MQTADILVIGAGIAGVSAAAHLARHGRVTLLEAEAQPGYHATGRSAAIFIRNYGNETLRALNAAAEPIFQAPKDLSDQPLLSPRGELLLAAPEELPALENYLDGAVGVERLSAAQAAELVPILQSDKIAAAAIEWDAQDIDVNGLLQGYLRQFRRAGGHMVTQARVQSLSHSAGVWTVQTAQGRYQAQTVVNAAGAWAGEIARMAGAHTIELTPCRRSAALIPAPAGYDISGWPLFGSVAENWYAKPDAGRLMVSPAEEDPVAPQDAWADDMVLAEGLARYHAMVKTPITRLERSWAGLRTFARDYTPVVGFDPDLSGFFWLAGQGGYGVQTAPALASITEQLITDREVAHVACLGEEVLAALSPARGGLSS